MVEWKYKEHCPGYLGLCCVDGSCPIANIDEYIEYGCDVVWTCKDCHMYRGCEDCAEEIVCTPELKEKYGNVK